MKYPLAGGGTPGPHARAWMTQIAVTVNNVVPTTQGLLAQSGRHTTLAA
jgi:hypothetical protein